MKILAAAFALVLSVSLLIGTTMLRASGSGKSIFLDNKCSSCHSIESQGIARTGSGPVGGKEPPDLSTVGLRHSASWMTQWLQKEVEMNGKKHLKKFAGSDDDLASLTSWLASLKSAKSSAAPAPKPKPPQPHVEAPKAIDTTPKVQVPPATDTTHVALTPAKSSRSAFSDVIAQHPILFAVRKTTPQSDSALRYATDLLLKNKTMKVEIQGHCDSVESPKHATQLSKNRALAVRRYLVSHGISAKRITVVALGATKPEASNATEEGRQANRRVDLRQIK
ncbi:MAG: OmpA family protein [Bacteroidota bacterium]|nr:OmpA family protein [Bacteroidota bacterium]MDP4234335.1 OmpA family protein [Bacteroidota bacterium]MDP4243269.1 OmpA family protein [Bacteroidota bacterium]MDP4289094.1 OmpA family protein [Bacteroidota bacterium]